MPKNAAVIPAVSIAVISLLCPAFLVAAGIEVVNPPEPAIGDTRRHIDGILGKPSLVRHGADGADTAKYDRGVVVYRDGKAVSLKLESPEAFEARAAQKALEERRKSEADSARILALRKADNEARDDFVGSPEYLQLPRTARPLALDRFFSYHPNADMVALRASLAEANRTASVAGGSFRSSAATPFSDILHARFGEWDLNHDGRLQPEEVDRLLLRTDITGENAAALVAIKGYQRRAAYWRGQSFSPSEAEICADGLALSHPDGNPARKYEMSAVYLSYRTGIGMINHDLFANGTPDFGKLRQGDVGNCYFFAVIGYLAKLDPERLRGMIEPQPDGAYLVKLGNSENVVVSPRSDARLIQNDTVSTLTDGVWLPVLEEAFSRKLLLRIGSDAPTDEIDTMMTGGTPSTIIRLLSGRNGPVYLLRSAFGRDPTLVNVRRDIRDALASKKVAVAGMPASPPITNGRIPGLAYSHAYAIVGYDASTDRVTLWNPWCNDFAPADTPGIRNGYSTASGEFSLPLPELCEQFGNVFFESR